MDLIAEQRRWRLRRKARRRYVLVKEGDLQRGASALRRPGIRRRPVRGWRRRFQALAFAWPDRRRWCCRYRSGRDGLASRKGNKKEHGRPARRRSELPGTGILPQKRRHGPEPYRPWGRKSYQPTGTVRRF